jgi:hypothetical protein
MKRLIASLFLMLSLTNAYADFGRGHHGGFGGGHHGGRHHGGFGPGYHGGFGYNRPFYPIGNLPFITPYNYMNYVGYQQFGFYQWAPAFNYYYWSWYPNYQPMWWTPYYYTTPYWNGYYL